MTAMMTPRFMVRRGDELSVWAGVSYMARCPPGGKDGHGPRHGKTDFSHTAGKRVPIIDRRGGEKLRGNRINLARHHAQAAPFG